MLLKQFNDLSLVVRNPVCEVSNQVRHKPGWTAIVDGYMLEISDCGSRGTTIYVAKNKGADQLNRYHIADLRLCFRICKKQVFSSDIMGLIYASLQAAQCSYFSYFFLFFPSFLFLAHLSRRLIGELIVYKGIRRPSVPRPSVNIFKRHLL